MNGKISILVVAVLLALTLVPRPAKADAAERIIAGGGVTGLPANPMTTTASGGSISDGLSPIIKARNDALERQREITHNAMMVAGALIVAFMIGRKVGRRKSA